MFGISFYEFIVILFVVLVVFKPKDIASLISGWIKTMNQIKKTIFDIKEDVKKLDVINEYFDDYIIIDKKKDSDK